MIVYPIQYKRKVGQRFLLLLCLLAALPPAGAQFVRGRVVHADTREPLPYVHIGWLGKLSGTISDEAGEFRLSAKDIHKGDTLRLSAIGYSPEWWINEGDIPTDTLTFELEPTAYDLPEATSSSATQDAKLGCLRLQVEERVWGAGGVPSGEELGRIFYLENRQRVQLDTFHFHLKYNDKDSLLFRLNLYEWNGREPGSSLLREDIRFWIHPADSVSASGWFHIPLAPYQLLTECDFVGTLELLRHSVHYGYPPIFLSSEKRGEPAIYRPAAQAKWVRLAEATFAFSFSVRH